MGRSIVAAITAAALLTFAPGADAKRHHHCAIKGGSVVAKDRQAVVLTRDTESTVESDTEYWGCLRATGRRVYMDAESSDQYGQTSLGSLVLRGTFVAYGLNTTAIDNSCHGDVHVFSLKRRDTTGEASQTPIAQRSPYDCPSVVKLLLTPSGRAAWTSTQGSDNFVRKLDPGGEATLDQGAIDTSSLRLTSGGLATWTNAGAPRSAQLR